MSEAQKRIDNANRLDDMLERTGGFIDVGAIYEGAQRAVDERAERQRKIREQQQAEFDREQAEVTALLAKVGEHVLKEKETKAEQEIKEAKAKAEVELAAQIRKQNGLLSEEEEVTNNSYKNMLGSLKL